MMKNEFLKAINDKLKVRITFYSKEDNKTITRLCAPLDYGPKHGETIPLDRFHLWDFESDSKKNHILGLEEKNIKEMELTNETFDPKAIVTWERKRPWYIKRHWGDQS